jgi:hypothetical protein
MNRITFLARLSPAALTSEYEAARANLLACEPGTREYTRAESALTDIIYEMDRRAAVEVPHAA